jgi:hypothetical protein
MDDPRELVLRNVRSRGAFQVDQSYRAHIRESLLDAVFYTLADYIRHERDTDDMGLGKLERLHSFPRDFLDCEDPHEWLEANRHTDDRSLIMFIHDRVPEMTQGKHRRILLYLINILHFGL